MPTKIYVALNFPDTVGEALVYAKHIASCMTGNAYFPSPVVPIATLLAHIDTLEAAEVTTKTGAHGTAAARDVELSTVHNDLKQLKTQVETVATQYPLAEAQAVVVSSGMSVKNVAGPTKAPFAAKQGKRSGSVVLSARHPGHGIVASFDWQYSIDGGVTWIDLPRTVHADLDWDGLTPGVLHFFRYRTLTRDGLSDWSDPVTLRVV